MENKNVFGISKITETFNKMGNSFHALAREIKELSSIKINRRLPRKLKKRLTNVKSH